MVINHNISALNTYNKLNANTKATQSSLEKLSSGSRINKAGDDAAGLAISQKMQAQINGLDQASTNAQNGISLVQTADGALSETQSILQRMNTLATESANDTNTDTDRTAMQTEVDQLTQEIDRIANTTQFNTKNLLNGSSGIEVNQTGSGIVVAGGTADVKAGAQVAMTSITAAKSASLTITASAVNNDLSVGTGNHNLVINGTTISLTTGMTGQQVADAINAQSSITGVKASYTAKDVAVAGALKIYSNDTGSNSTFSISGAQVGAATAPADTFVDGAAGDLVMTDTSGGAVASLNAAATSSETGVDASASISTAGVSIASTTGNVITLKGTGVDGLKLDVTNSSAANTVTISSNGGLNMQIGANEGQTMYVSIDDMRASALGVSNLNISNATSAGSAITTIQTAINKVSTERANLGAYENRLDHTINNLSTQSENLSSASSQITDVDMAKEMTEYSKYNILTQAAESMLAQANQLPQGVLSLLK